MSEKKRYTADELREAAGRVVSELYTNPFADMLRQAADAEEEREVNEKVKWSADKSVKDERDRLIAENAQLKARLNAVEKACEQAKKLVSQISMPLKRENGWCSTDPMIATGLNTIFSAVRGE